MDPITPVQGVPPVAPQTPVVPPPPPPIGEIPIQPPIPPPQPQPESKGINWILIFVGFIITAIIFGGAYYFNQTYNQQANITPTPTIAKLPSPTPDPTANWKTYTNKDLSFKYPSDWSMSGFVITSNLPKIRLVVVPSDSTLMNECMQETSTETKNNHVIKKFSRVTTGAMCDTSDSTPREIWVMKSPATYAPGISYKYSSLEGSQAETIFDQILSTFKFTSVSPTLSCTPRPACLDQNPACSLEAQNWCLPTATPSGVVCTQEAKLCPDGSSVGRTGPTCEFKACPK